MVGSIIVGMLGIGLLLFTFAAPAFSLQLERSVVMIRVSKQETDYDSPWQKRAVSLETHLGTLVGKDQILVTAYAVQNAQFLELQKFGDSEKFPLRVKFVDYEVNLAVVVPEKKTALDSLVPLSIGEDLRENSPVIMVEDENQTKLKQNLTHITEVSVQNSVTSNFWLVHYEIFSRNTSGYGWSEPVIKDGKLVGMTTAQERNTVSAIPASALKHFLYDRHDKSYRGFPAMGIITNPLVSPHLRRLVKGEAFNHGVRVANVLNNSPFKGALKEDDILLELNGTKVGDDGYISHKLWGKIYFSYLITELHGGDTVAVAVARQGKLMNHKRKVGRYSSNDGPIPYYQEINKEPHVIFGGLVFHELSMAFLKTWGRDWSRSGPSQFLYLWHYQNWPRENGTYRYLVLNRVLADEFNQGYEKLEQNIVTKVNNEAVANLEDLKKTLMDRKLDVGGKKYCKIDLQFDGGQIILGYQGLEQAHFRIAKKYNINSADSFLKIAEN